MRHILDRTIRSWLRPRTPSRSGLETAPAAWTNARTYHTFYDEFHADSAQDLVQALYENSRRGTGCSHPEWWRYQQAVWKQVSERIVPEPDEPLACEKLVDILVDVGALEPGPQPPRDRLA
jgi:hypothetical protein